MNEMTLPSRHRLLNSSNGILRTSTLPLDHGGSLQYGMSTKEQRRNILFLCNLTDRVMFEPTISAFPASLQRLKQTALTSALGPLPFGIGEYEHLSI